MKKAVSSKPPAWDLSDLFKSITDPAIEKIFADTDRKSKAFVKEYKGKLTNTTAAAKILKALKGYEAIFQDLFKPENYAYLLFSTDAANADYGAFLQRTKTRTVEIAQQLVFFEVELSKLDATRLKKLATDPTLKAYRHYLQLQLTAKPHRLSEAEEKLMNDKSLTGRSALVRLYDEELSTKAFNYTNGKRIEKKSQTELLHLLYDPNRKVRKQASEDFTKGLGEEMRGLAFVTNTLIQDKQIDDRYRDYPSPEASRHQANEISQTVVDAMSSVVTKSYSIVQDFYRFKKRVMKTDKLHDYDRYAPIATTNKKFSYDAARKIVLSAFGKFSPDMAATAKEFFDHNWIHATLQPGKRGGAYCMFVTPDLHPYVFTNFHGSTKCVMTLAHELGHAVHACRARSQTFLNFEMPLTVAETASIFGEMLVFDDLRSQLDDANHFALIMEKLENIFASVHRQTSMYLFEKDLHAAGRAQGELKPEQINAIWRKRQLQMYGNAVTLTPNYDLWWSYIPHFIHTPFYVYAYAFGELLTLSLFAQYKKHGPEMVEKYHAMLDAGGSITPEEMVKPFGIDLSDPKFWQGGILIIQDLIKQAKKLHAKIEKTK